jgi:ribonuclease HI
LQALADFMAEWTKVQIPTPDITHEYWTLYFDGLVMAPGAGAGVVLISPEGNRLRYMIRLHFPVSNNIAKYEGLINGLRITIELGATRLSAYGDSKLVVDQVMKESNCESSLVDAYYQEVRKLEDKLQGIKLHCVPRRDNNNNTDTLTKMAAQRDPAPNRVFLNDFHAPSIWVKPDSPQGPTDPVPEGPTLVPPDRGFGGPTASRWRPQP